MREIEFDDIICQYKNPELVKRGGQRVVFKITHPKFGNAALKVGNYCTQEDQEGWELERIEREINLLKKIDSPYYPKNFGFEKVSNNRYVILEEFVESTPLSECMNRFQTSIEVIILIKNLVNGLKIIWDMNIVHRDIKPENILIKPTGLPKIIDLGIARALDSNSITQTMFSGPCSKLYAAPELLRYNKKSIDWRTDQYNLGIILVQLLLKGTHPFDPSLVKGASIPQNIIDDNWYKKVFEDGNLLPMCSLASKLLGNQPYQRFRKYEFLMKEIDSCMGSLV